MHQTKSEQRTWHRSSLINLARLTDLKVVGFNIDFRMSLSLNIKLFVHHEYIFTPLLYILTLKRLCRDWRFHDASREKPDRNKDDLSLRCRTVIGSILREYKSVSRVEITRCCACITVLMS